jgi:N-methylhydantoinase A/oxoprolinase/acetone carboxylase beta subunit
MSIVLGIDTGGTYTDAVIIDLDTKEIFASAKAPTTHYHLIDGINEAIDRLTFDRFSDVEYASLSTTLATNAIVEGRGCRVGLLLLGFIPRQSLPQCEVALLPGEIDLHGTVVTPIDREKTRQAIAAMKGKVDAVAVSGILSIRNPVLENEVKAMVREILGLPCIAAHELSTVLGMHERTVTAVLNGRLLSVIDELMEAVKAALSQKNMNIPVMIVKGDGSLMNEVVAKDRPIETILSGPAASIIGATFLNGAENGLIVDIGGTTTDIAVMKNGRPRIDPEGSFVGGWRTRVAATEVNTFGLGGDSRIWFDGIAGGVKVGPRRVYPISTVAKTYPNYLDELRQLFPKKIGMMMNELCEGYLLLRQPPKGMEMNTMEETVVDFLQEEPHTVYAVSQRIGMDSEFLKVDRLIEHGVIAMVGFTPTDLLHVTGEYVKGDVQSAKLALQLIAKRWGEQGDDVMKTMRYHITDRLAHTILDSVISYERIATDAMETKQMQTLVKKAFYGDAEELFTQVFRLNMPLLGIGAPVKAWLTSASEKFHTEVIYPAYHDVANAVGAAAGKVMHIYRISVQNHEVDGIHIYAPWGCIAAVAEEEEKANDIIDENAERIYIGECRGDRMIQMEKAIEYAIQLGKTRLQREMAEQGSHFDLLVERRDKKATNNYSENLSMFIESELEIIAVGRPSW